MTKAEILKQEKEKQIELCENLTHFLKKEGFTETIDKIGNFALKMPLFHKKNSENTFLAFNFPTFDKIKKYEFTADFWKVIAKSEKEFLNLTLEKENLIDLRLSFDLKEDISLYREQF